MKLEKMPEHTALHISLFIDSIINKMHEHLYENKDIYEDIRNSDYILTIALGTLAHLATNVLPIENEEEFISKVGEYLRYEFNRKISEEKGSIDGCS